VAPARRSSPATRRRTSLPAVAGHRALFAVLILSASGAGVAAAPAAAGAASRGACAHRSSYRSRHGSGGASRPSCPAHSRRHGRRGSAACTNTQLLPTPADLERIRGAVLCLVNRERARHHEAPLQPNGRLRRAAQEHTVSMAYGGYFAHGSPLSRMRAVGYISRPGAFYEVGENIAWGTLSLSTPRAIVAAWMASPGHRANILDARFHDTAVGVSAHLPSDLGGGQRGAIYTQDFGVVRHG
jgi:uncharacterized protein YkwD